MLFDHKETEQIVFTPFLLLLDGRAKCFTLPNFTPSLPPLLYDVCCTIPTPYFPKTFLNLVIIFWTCPPYPQIEIACNQFTLFGQSLPRKTCPTIWVGTSFGDWHTCSHPQLQRVRGWWQWISHDRVLIYFYLKIYFSVPIKKLRKSTAQVLNLGVRTTKAEGTVVSYNSTWYCIQSGCNRNLFELREMLSPHLCKSTDLTWTICKAYINLEREDGDLNKAHSKLWNTVLYAVLFAAKVDTTSSNYPRRWIYIVLEDHSVFVSVEFNARATFLTSLMESQSISWMVDPFDWLRNWMILTV